MLYLTFITFVLFICACSGDWVLGGREFGDNTGSTASQAHFHVSLQSVGVEAYIARRGAARPSSAALPARPSPPSPPAHPPTRFAPPRLSAAQTDVWMSSGNPGSPSTYNNLNRYDRSLYLKRAAIQNNFVASPANLLPGWVPNPAHSASNFACVRGEADFTTSIGGLGPQNWWCGSGVTNKMNGQIDDAFGLMVVATLLAAFAWVLMTMVAQGNSALVGRPYAYEAIAATYIASAFFGLLSVAVFDASGLTKAFCSVFDPDANVGVYCGYYDGFGAVRLPCGPLLRRPRSGTRLPVPPFSSSHPLAGHRRRRAAVHCWRPVFSVAPARHDGRGRHVRLLRRAHGQGGLCRVRRLVGRL